MTGVLLRRHRSTVPYKSPSNFRDDARRPAVAKRERKDGVTIGWMPDWRGRPEQCNLCGHRPSRWVRLWPTAPLPTTAGGC
jgi:hypothetical protein